MKGTTKPSGKKRTNNIRRLTTEEVTELANNRDLRRLTDEEYKKLLKSHPPAGGWGRKKKWVNQKDLDL